MNNQLKADCSECVLETHNLVKTYFNGGVITPVLKGIDFQVKPGEFVAIMGRSGAGKSTFLYQLSLLDDSTSGKIFVEGYEIHNLSHKQKANFRLNKFGYVFQDYALLPDLTAEENVALPLLMQGKSKKVAYQVAREFLSKAGLSHRYQNFPSQLSGGEQQRVSIARAVAHNPKVLFADEPTANLDRESSKLILNMFHELNQKGQTIIMVTHEEEYGKQAKRLVRLDDGLILSDQPLP
jgi:ABC-type antimicrobial peptide transport system, ATPase component